MSANSLEAREITANAKLAEYSVCIRDEQGQQVASFQGLVYRKGSPLPGLGADQRS